MFRRAAPLALAALAASCARQAPRSLNASLPTLDGSGQVELSSCPTPRCLTVYVAPWCGVCRASTGLFKALRVFLAANGVATRIVVGKDSPEAVRAYAADFGADTLLDPSGRVRLGSGVPQLVATDASGNVLRTMAGLPAIYAAPYPEELLLKFARYLRLL